MRGLWNTRHRHRRSHPHRRRRPTQHNKEKERAAGRGSNRIRGITAAAAAASGILMPVAGSLRGHVEEEISTMRLGFSFCFADKTLDGDDGKRVIRRRRSR